MKNLNCSHFIHSSIEIYLPMSFDALHISSEEGMSGDHVDCPRSSSIYRQSHLELHLYTITQHTTARPNSTWKSNTDASLCIDKELMYIRQTVTTKQKAQCKNTIKFPFSVTVFKLSAYAWNATYPYRKVVFYAAVILEQHPMNM